MSKCRCGNKGEHETDSEGILCHYCYYELYLANSPSFDKDVDRCEETGIWNLAIPKSVYEEIIQIV